MASWPRTEVSGAAARGDIPPGCGALGTGVTSFHRAWHPPYRSDLALGSWCEEMPSVSSWHGAALCLAQPGDPAWILSCDGQTWVCEPGSREPAVIREHEEFHLPAALPPNWGRRGGSSVRAQGRLL